MPSVEYNQAKLVYKEIENTYENPETGETETVVTKQQKNPFVVRISKWLKESGNYNLYGYVEVTPWGQDLNSQSSPYDWITNNYETSSFVDRGPQRNQEVEYRVVRKNGGITAESNSVQTELPEFAEVPNPVLGNSNKPRFSNIGVPGSGGSVKLYKANGVQPVFPDDYTLVQESSNGIDEFNDDAASNDSYVSYAFTSVDSNGNESKPDIRQTFVPPKDAAVLRDNNTQ